MSTPTTPALPNQTSQPYQPHGYPKLASLMGHHPQAALFRRFGPLTMLTLLNLQAELVSIDRQLRDTTEEEDTSGDSEMAKWSDDFYELRRSERKRGTPRRYQLEQAQKKLIVYHEMLARYAEVEKLPKPSKANTQFLRDWLDGDEEGSGFLRERERTTWDACNDFDLVTLDVTKGKDGAIFEWVDEMVIGVYHWAWGGRGEHTKLADGEVGRVLRYDDSRTLSGILTIFWISAVLVALAACAFVMYAFISVTDTPMQIGFTIVGATFSTLVMICMRSFATSDIFTANAVFVAMMGALMWSANRT